MEAGKVSVGRHHGPAHRVQVRFACEDLDLLRRRLRQVDSDIGRTLGDHVVGTLLTTMDGIGPTTAAMRKLLIAVHFAANHREPFVPILAEAAA